MEKDIWKRGPGHNFRAILSGARNFLGGQEDIPPEISCKLVFALPGKSRLFQPGNLPPSHYAILNIYPNFRKKEP